MPRMFDQVSKMYQQLAADREAVALAEMDAELTGEALHASLLSRAVDLAQERATSWNETGGDRRDSMVYRTDPVPLPELSTDETAVSVRLVGTRCRIGSNTGKPLDASLILRAEDTTGKVKPAETDWVEFGALAKFLAEDGTEVAKGLGVVDANERGYGGTFRTALSGASLDEVVAVLDLFDQQLA